MWYFVEDYATERPEFAALSPACIHQIMVDAALDFPSPAV
jgi:hypothetical protein